MTKTRTGSAWTMRCDAVVVVAYRYVEAQGRASSMDDDRAGL
jgi:hypothetical protein